MKNILLLILFLTLSGNMLSQKGVGTVVYKSGEKKEGIIKVISGYRLKFKENKKSKAERFDLESVKKIILSNSEGEGTTYITEKINNNPVLLKVITIGAVSLYSEDVVYVSNNSSGSGVVGSDGGIFYLKKKDSNDFVKVQSNTLFANYFIDSVIDYFKDCESLKNKIISKKYKYKDIKSIVIDYNTNCK